MAFANTSYSDILATTIERRSGKIADNVANNNAVLAQLKQKGRIRTFAGGHKILEELSFAENSNGDWYSGYDVLPVATSDVISAAEFAIKQYAVPVVMSGLEELQNAGPDGIIDLMEARLGVAEATMANDLSVGIYSDGTGSNSKQLVGLDSAVPADPTTGTYGGISRVNYTFWRPKITTTTVAAANCQALMNTMWAQCSRGADRPDLILAGNTVWGIFMGTLQTIQRFTDPAVAKLGFPSTKFIDADVVLDGGNGGAATATNFYFLNTKYIHWRPHKDRNMVPLAPQKRYAINQDAQVQILAWAGALTMSGSKFHGRITGA